EDRADQGSLPDRRGDRGGRTRQALRPDTGAAAFTDPRVLREGRPGIEGYADAARRRLGAGRRVPARLSRSRRRAARAGAAPPPPPPPPGHPAPPRSPPPPLSPPGPPPPPPSPRPTTPESGPKVKSRRRASSTGPLVAGLRRASPEGVCAVRPAPTMA